MLGALPRRRVLLLTACSSALLVSYSSCLLRAFVSGSAPAGAFTRTFVLLQESSVLHTWHSCWEQLHAACASVVAMFELLRVTI